MMFLVFMNRNERVGREELNTKMESSEVNACVGTVPKRECSRLG